MKKINIKQWMLWQKPIMLRPEVPEGVFYVIDEGKFEFYKVDKKEIKK